MKIGVAYRFGKDPFDTYSRLYIPIELKKILDDLSIQTIPLVTEVGLDELVEELDGLILPGSFADTNPSYYGEEALGDKDYSIDEYKYDVLLIEKFHKLNKPILGICGGHQELNVYFKGTLYQKIDGHNLVDHNISIKEDSFLYEVYKSPNTIVNSYHNQAIKDLAPGFKATAISDDGIIEGIEMDNIVAIQYHPEKIYDMGFFRAYFHKFYNI